LTDALIGHRVNLGTGSRRWSGVSLPLTGKLVQYKSDRSLRDGLPGGPLAYQSAGITWIIMEELVCLQPSNFLKGDSMIIVVVKEKKKYGCLKFLFDVFMTAITGGLWLIWIFVREMRNA
jgi:hypothetical protein